MSIVSYTSKIKNELNKIPCLISSPFHTAILSVLLHEGEELEAAFANFRFWQSLGFVVSFSFSVSHLLVFYKLLALIGLLVLSMLMYYILEYIVKLEKKNEKPPSRRGSSVRRS